ncbi:MAG: PqqD family protein [Candidatus Omnitrophica bacterium]|nr:PqqD family protein [Candidatus Omnitrophota bacterium]
MYIKAHKDWFSKETDDGLALLNPEGDKIFTLNKTASCIWKIACSGSRVSMDDILQGLKKKFAIKEKDLKKYRKECTDIVKKNSELFNVFEN